MQVGGRVTTSSKQRSVSSSIPRKLIGIVLLAITVTTFLVTLASGWQETSLYADVKTEEIRGTAYVFSSTVSDPLAAGDRVGVLKALRAIGKIPNLSYIRVEDIKGKHIAELGTAVALDEDPDLPILLRSSLQVRVPVVKAGKPIGSLVLLAETSDLRTRLINGFLTGLGAAILAALIGVAIAYRLQKRITDPLRRLTTSMSNIHETHDFTGRVETTSTDEIGVLVDAFNGMMGQIRDRDKSLTDHQKHLEQKVDDRTRDLKEAKIIAEESNAAKSDFLATMSHEIRTPMNGMLVMAELLASAELTQRHRRYADVIVKSGQSLLSIINDILDFSKIESGKLELEVTEFSPSEVAEDVLNLFWERAASKGLDLAARVDNNVPDRVMADPVRLNQVLSNLVNNAIKFTDSGFVELTISCNSTVSDAPGLQLDCAVRDSGIGIPEDKCETIFESFAQADQSTTRRFGGTGLGLAICKRLVEAMGGDIRASSVVGDGSTFHFTINVQPANVHSETVDTVRGVASEDLSLKQAVVCMEGDASIRAIKCYLDAFGISSAVIMTDQFALPSVMEADIVFCQSKWITQLSERGEGRDKLASPFVVGITQMGDINGDEAIERGLADELLMRPISKTALTDILERLQAGKPLGRATLQAGTAIELPDFTGTQVLVADDSPVNREVVIEAMKRFKVQADVVEDGRQAVTAAGSKRYDIIFMDCSMPEMDGFEASRVIREQERNAGDLPVPIVALTANVAGRPADEWRRVGMNDYMTKPFRITDLAQRFVRFVGQKHKQPLEPEVAQIATSELGVSVTESAVAAIPMIVDEATETVVSSAGLVVIDEDVLANIVGGAGADSLPLICRILNLFANHGPLAMERIADAAANRNSDEIGPAAHALKSLCRNIGATQLGDLCGQLEENAQNGKLDDLPARLAELKSALDAVLARIAEISKTGEQKGSNAVHQ